MRSIGRRKTDKIKILVGMALGAVLVAYAVYTAACGEISTTEPTPTTSAPTTAAAAPAPAPTATPTVVDPTKGPEHDAQVKRGFYSVTNTTEIPQFYCAAAFGVFPGGEQGAGTNLFQDQGVRQPKDVFSGQAPKTAGCQYKQIQVDLTQTQDCRTFNWHNVLAAEVYANPAFIASSETETLPDEISYVYTEGQSSEKWCGSRTKIVTGVKKYRCSGEIVKTEKSRTVEEGPSCCAAPGLTLACTFRSDWLGGEYRCTANASVPSHFSWDPDYDDVSLNTGQSCRDSSKEDFRVYRVDDWNLQKLASVKVTAGNCECPNNVASASWYRSN